MSCFISPDKLFSDDKNDKKRKVRATLFDTNVDVYDDGATEEYINACIKFFNSIPKETIVNKAHEHFEQIRSISEGPGIDEVADYGDGDNILPYIKLKAMHVSTIKDGDPEHVWFIMEGDTPWSDGFEFVVADNKLVISNHKFKAVTPGSVALHDEPYMFGVAAFFGG